MSFKYPDEYNLRKQEASSRLCESSTLDYNQAGLQGEITIVNQS